MNLLAHAYLSFNNPEILVGNMISDYVKGKKKFEYSASIQKGISLHRAIDEYTDHHPATQEAKLFFKPAYRLYAGAFVDVVYDHFLANDSNEFANSLVLSEFANHTYHVLDLHEEVMPQKFAAMLPYMRQQNWLYNYRLTEGTQKSLKGLVSRSAYLNDAATAFDIFLMEYDRLLQLYQQFFPSLKAFAKDWYHNEVLITE